MILQTSPDVVLTGAKQDARFLEAVKNLGKTATAQQGRMEFHSIPIPIPFSLVQQSLQIFFS